ncbi:helix-turn-helix domain-containing protein [Bittarella massiliensis (ex Durand et al. 2017)]|uniref:Helix-turn-helix domain-containing protein n=1 Tax=Bittarella massiliensis (ex Durand et al. 2017) TaxID=1720313 RepID=A0ABW9WVQ8_9FIRM|nr:helix-turn-helix transcriptional regulator [Bittarella massiliensis (ex Durand et al. 2017)]MZL69172.1 helix-turn-helix domain-containing protein [Bittarella massiliensis (ex Durand et al. 2017)]MZL79822.1 helix-turn-helix domain-containing protein [Bittarella massiliensis (ex Durand et al. 2017)]
MYKNKAPDGRNNLCGKQIARLRKQMRPRVSQRLLAERLQVLGLDLDKNAIQRIENGSRFATDVELAQIAQLLQVSMEELTEGRTG